MHCHPLPPMLTSLLHKLCVVLTFIFGQPLPLPLLIDIVCKWSFSVQIKANETSLNEKDITSDDFPNFWLHRDSIKHNHRYVLLV